MHKLELDFTFPGSKKESRSETTRVLTERNTTTTPRSRSASRAILYNISASSRKRHEAFLLKQRKERLRRRRLVRKIEYQRLRTMVPSIATKPLVSKVTVIEEAIRYIDYLHDALLNRLRTKGLPSCLQGVEVDVNQLRHDDIKDLVCQLVQRTNSLQQQQGSANPPSTRQANAYRNLDSTVPVSYFERSRQVPSYLTPRRPLRKRIT